MPVKGQITRILVQDQQGNTYADGLEFDVPAPTVPIGTMLTWTFHIKNIGDQDGPITFHLRQILYQGQPLEGDYFNTPVQVIAGQTAGLTPQWGYPDPALDGTVAWRFTAETNGVIDDSLILTANAETGHLTSKLEAPSKGVWKRFLEWWNSLSSLQKVLVIAAFPVSMFVAYEVNK